MSGTLSPVGALSIGTAVPCLPQMVAGINGSLSFRLPALNAQIKGLLSATLTPPQIGASAAATAVANLSAQVRLGLPGATVSLGIIAGAIAKLQASIGSLSAQLALAGNLAALLGTAGVQSYSYGGAVNVFGPALGTATSSGFPGGGGPGATCNALVLVTQVAGTWAAMQAVFSTGSGSGLQYLGNASLGSCLPLALAASLGLTATVGIVLPSISLQLAAFLQVSLGLGIQLPSLTGNLKAAVTLAAQLALVVTLPALTVQAGLLVKLQAELLQLSAQLSLALSISLLLGLGGLCVYSYTGNVASLGPTVSAGLAGGLLTGGTPASNCNALVLATESGATWSAIGGALKVVA